MPSHVNGGLGRRRKRKRFWAHLVAGGQEKTGNVIMEFADTVGGSSNFQVKPENSFSDTDGFFESEV